MNLLNSRPLCFSPSLRACEFGGSVALGRGLGICISNSRLALNTGKRAPAWWRRRICWWGSRRAFWQCWQFGMKSGVRCSITLTEIPESSFLGRKRLISARGWEVHSSRSGGPITGGWQRAGAGGRLHGEAESRENLGWTRLLPSEDKPAVTWRPPASPTSQLP